MIEEFAEQIQIEEGRDRLPTYLPLTALPASNV